VETLATWRRPGKATRYIVLVLPALVIAGCNESVRLRHVKTGQEITCGGEMMLPGRRSDIDRCVKLMQEAGYRKVDQER
jgi:hypothetical protein